MKPNNLNNITHAFIIDNNPEVDYNSYMYLLVSLMLTGLGYLSWNYFQNNFGKQKKKSHKDKNQEGLFTQVNSLESFHCTLKKLLSANLVEKQPNKATKKFEVGVVQKLLKEQKESNEKENGFSEFYLSKISSQMPIIEHMIEASNAKDHTEPLDSNIVDSAELMDSADLREMLIQKDLDVFHVLSMLDKLQLTPTAETYSLLIDLAFKYGQTHQAHNLFSAISDNNLPICHSVTIDSYINYLDSYLDSALLPKIQEQNSMELNSGSLRNSFINKPSKDSIPKDKQTDLNIKKQSYLLVSKTKVLLDEILKSKRFSLSKEFFDIMTKVLFFSTNINNFAVAESLLQENIESLLEESNQSQFDIQYLSNGKQASKSSNNNNSSKQTSSLDKDSVAAIQAFHKELASKGSYKISHIYKYLILNKEELSLSVEEVDTYTNIIEILGCLQEYEVLEESLKEALTLEIEFKFYDNKEVLKHLYNFKILKKNDLLFFLINRNLYWTLRQDLEQELSVVKRRRLRQNKGSTVKSSSKIESPFSFLGLSSHNDLFSNSSNDVRTENTEYSDFEYQYNDNIQEVLRSSFEYSKETMSKNYSHSNMLEATVGYIYINYGIMKVINKEMFDREEDEGNQRRVGKSTEKRSTIAGSNERSNSWSSPSSQTEMDSVSKDLELNHTINETEKFSSKEQDTLSSSNQRTDKFNASPSSSLNPLSTSSSLKEFFYITSNYTSNKYLSTELFSRIIELETIKEDFPSAIKAFHHYNSLISSYYMTQSLFSITNKIYRERVFAIYTVTLKAYLKQNQYESLFKEDPQTNQSKSGSNFLLTNNSLSKTNNSLAPAYKTFSFLGQLITSESETKPELQVPAELKALYISILFESSRQDEVKDLYERLRHSKYLLNETILLSLLKGYCLINDCISSVTILRELSDRRIALKTPAYSCLLRMYASLNSEEKVIEKYDEMLRANCKPDVSCYCALIEIFLRKKKLSHALGILNDIKQEKKLFCEVFDLKTIENLALQLIAVKKTEKLVELVRLMLSNHNVPNEKYYERFLGKVIDEVLSAKNNLKMNEITFVTKQLFELMKKNNIEVQSEYFMKVGQVLYTGGRGSSFNCKLGYNSNSEHASKSKNMYELKGYTNNSGKKNHYKKGGVYKQGKRLGKEQCSFSNSMNYDEGETTGPIINFSSKATNAESYNYLNHSKKHQEKSNYNKFDNTQIGNRKCQYYNNSSNSYVNSQYEIDKSIDTIITPENNSKVNTYNNQRKRNSRDSGDTYNTNNTEQSNGEATHYHSGKYYFKSSYKNKLSNISGNKPVRPIEQYFRKTKEREDNGRKESY